MEVESTTKLTNKLTNTFLGLNVDSDMVIWLWEIVNEMNNSQQRV